MSLHKNATTTPATRIAIQQAHGTEAELSQRFGVGKLTIRECSASLHACQEAGGFAGPGAGAIAAGAGACCLVLTQ